MGRRTLLQSIQRVLGLRLLRSALLARRAGPTVDAEACSNHCRQIWASEALLQDKPLFQGIAMMAICRMAMSSAETSTPTVSLNHRLQMHLRMLGNRIL